MLSKAIASHRHLRTVLLVICAMSATLVVSSAVAQAKLIRPYTGESFGSAGLGVGSFGQVKSIAVDQSSGDVYIFDQQSDAIYKFTAAGAPANFSSSGTNAIREIGGYGSGAEQQLAVDSSPGPAKGDIYIANNQVVEIYSAAGVRLGELTGGEACGVAVDPTGAVYVGFYPSTVKKYVPAGNPVTASDYTESLTGLQGICNIAADSEGNVYAANYSGGVRRYAAIQFGALEAEGTLIDKGGSTLAVDASRNDVFVDEGNRIVEFNAAGEVQSLAGEGELESSFGVVVNEANGDTYADSKEGRVDIFGAPVVEPDATTEAPTGITRSGGTVNGGVNPDGVAASYQFQYGTSTSYGSVTPAAPGTVGSDSTIHHLSAQLTGLAPGSTYHYRIVASNANGTSYGADQILDTHGPPTILTERFVRATQRAAYLEAGFDPHGLDTSYTVEYGTTTGYGQSTSSMDLGAEGEALYGYPEITGLALGARYHFRVVATNAEGAVYGADHVFTTEPEATIAKGEIPAIATTSATISATVLDYESAVEAHFEYGTTSSYGTTLSSQALAAAEYPLTITGSLEELQPATTYHFRLVVESQVGTVYGSDVTFTTPSIAAPSLALPDGRVYERVSPGSNADSDVYQDLPYLLEPYEGSSTEQPVLVSPDGSAVAYIGGPAEHGGTGAEGSNYGEQYLATRNAAGHWEASDVKPLSSTYGQFAVFRGFSPDLSVGFLTAANNPPLAPGAPGEGYSELYAKVFSTGAYTALSTARPEHRTAKEFGTAESPEGDPNNQHGQLAYAGSSANLGHDLFMANDALTPSAHDGGARENNLYDSSGGTPTLVNVLPDGSTEPNATFGGPRLEVDEPYNGRYGNYPMLAHDISEDGSQIFWTDLNNHSLFVRENDTAPQSPLANGKCIVPADACTVMIAEAAQYWNATPDGSKVLYTKSGNLYEDDLQTGETIDLAPGGGVHGVVAASSDLSFVYFVAEAALVPGAESQTCKEQGFERGLCNLYAVHVGEPARFIGALSAEDNFAEPETYEHDAGDWQGSLSDTDAEATPDGAHLLFTSKENLTGYESEGAGEVFMYDYGSGEIDCLSCNPTGQAPTNQLSSSAYLPVSNVATAQPHWMSDDGNRAFFNTFDALVPQDINQKTDVYEWERDGIGGCTGSSGCIYLLSDGTSPEGSYLIGASTSGNDVFMTTRGKLAPEDENENTDVYDVRAGVVPPSASPRCTGSGCQGVPATPPVFATPPSVTYDGVGNFEASAKTSPAKPKSLTRARKLASALNACKRKTKQRRRACEAQAKKRYGAAKKGKSSASGRRGNIRQSSKGSK